LKGLLTSSKDPSSQQKNNNKEREREGREMDRGSPMSLQGKKKHKQTKRGSLIFLGKSLGKPGKRHSCLGQPRKLIFVSILKLIQAIHKGKWTWQFGQIVK
jgi:hypothetical protein